MSSDTQRNDSTMSVMPAPDDCTPRLDALESRVAFQEHWLDTLDDAVARQEQRLVKLERLSSLIQEKLRDQQRALQDNDGAASHPEDERPPHY